MIENLQVRMRLALISAGKSRVDRLSNHLHLVFDALAVLIQSDNLQSKWEARAN